MDQDSVKACFEIVDNLTKAVEALSYRRAMPTICELEELRAIIGEELPGGYLGPCAFCEILLGNDDPSGRTDEGDPVCMSCWGDAEKAGAVVEREGRG